MQTNSGKSTGLIAEKKFKKVKMDSFLSTEKIAG